MARKKATRKKVTLNYIHNNSTRRASFRKRLKGLMKKAAELATMCGVKTCVVVYGKGEAEPKVFPSHDKAVDILNEYKSMPDLGHCKKTMDQEAFLTKRIAKLHDKVNKARCECQDSEIRYLLYNIMHGNHPGLVDLSVEELARVGWKVEELLKSLGERMAKIEVQAPPPAPCISTGSIDMGSPSHYLASPQHQDGYLNMVSSGGDVGTQVYGENASHDGAGFSGGDMMMLMQSSDLVFSLSHFPPM
ncbi:agamous-like MADS-box protein AGL80 [Hordeum vulgare subsp. vulgare]|uniref:MADS-box domain-containing protein n=1 Tax=Hordeum vulgare subsp. vulgare TaxID=112509 RepID=A0A8I6XYI9_HORVV|nr:agamous-like MADS-box protein AGL80 [Hordeum vulgare subsp. vulgare]